MACFRCVWLYETRRWRSASSTKLLISSGSAIREALADEQRARLLAYAEHSPAAGACRSDYVICTHVQLFPL